MGYDLHVTPADQWSDKVGAEITLGEWRAVALADADLRADPDNGDGFYAAPGLREDGGDGWFDWFAGDVYTKDPDRATSGKLLALATSLGARVQGDDGEPYSSPDDIAAQTS
jgi:hypothetical protein